MADDPVRLDNSARADLNVLLVSPEFISNLPMAIPLSRASGVVDVSLTLPNGSRLMSSTITAADRRGIAPAAFTLLPKSVSGDELRAATRLATSSALAWDLSDVRYQPPPRLGSYLYRSLPIWGTVLLLALCVTVVSEVYWRRRAHTKREVSDGDIDDTLARAVSELAMLEKVRIRKTLESLWRERDHPIAEELTRALERDIAALGQLRRDFAVERRPPYQRILYWLTGIAAAVSLLGLLSTWALGQTPQGGKTPKAPSAASLGEFNMRVEPLNSPPDHVAVGFRFLALSAARSATGKRRGRYRCREQESGGDCRGEEKARRSEF